MQTEFTRHIPFIGGSNVRDIGGYETLDGDRVRWGRVYRSGSLWRLDQADWRWITENGIAAVCDLRSREERDISPTVWAGGETTRHLGEAYGADRLFRRDDRDAGVGEVAAGLYLLFAKLLATSFREFFAALLSEEVPMIVHCSAGQDRTGLAIGLLLHTLGVPRETIMADYQLSTAHRRIENEIDHAALPGAEATNAMARFYMDAIRRRGADAFTPRTLLNARGDALLLDAFDSIEANWGSLDAYLETLGVGPEQAGLLRSLLLDR